MGTKSLAFLLAVGFIAAGMTLSGHHAFNSEFDAKKPIKLRGTVTKMEWINPHAWIHVDVKKSDGSVEKWMIEAGTPNTLFRRGFTKNSLDAGTELTVDGYQAKNGSNKANGSSVTFRDGRRLFVGGSNPDVPLEQK